MAPTPATQTAIARLDTALAMAQQRRSGTVAQRQELLLDGVLRALQRARDKTGALT